ncbi:MAG: peptide chain release factor 2 [Patescibacteria group bacterium]
MSESNWVEKVRSLAKVLDMPKLQSDLKELERQMAAPDFWSDQKKAAQISRQASFRSETIEKFNDLQRAVTEISEMKSLAAKEQNWQSELANKEKEIEIKYGQLENQALFSGKYDQGNAILSIYAGAGGTDAQDWAEMLLRMYLRYCERKNWQTELIEIAAGQEAGIKYATIEVKGPTAYGHLRAEKGVHRLVRISPFDAEKMRHTSFAMVQVMPDLEDEAAIQIDEKDLRIDTYRSSGHGGQGVNTTDSAVRITHVPTGIAASCQNERSQAQNRETAMRILKSKLKRYFEAEKEEEKKEIRGEFTEAAWGNQIRSYVLHPYHHVKDHRTGHTVDDVESVLDGDLDGFVFEKLKN